MCNFLMFMDVLFSIVLIRWNIMFEKTLLVFVVFLGWFLFTPVPPRFDLPAQTDITNVSNLSPVVVWF